jgi:hypothetical protein
MKDRRTKQTKACVFLIVGIYSTKKKGYWQHLVIAVITGEFYFDSWESYFFSLGYENGWQGASPRNARGEYAAETLFKNLFVSH